MPVLTPEAEKKAYQMCNESIDKMAGSYITDLPAAYDAWKASQHIERMNYSADPQRRSLPPAPPPQCGFEEDK
jgi:hypothetical protein